MLLDDMLEMVGVAMREQLIDSANDGYDIPVPAAVYFSTTAPLMVEWMQKKGGYDRMIEDDKARLNNCKTVLMRMDAHDAVTPMAMLKLWEHVMPFVVKSMRIQSVVWAAGLYYRIGDVDKINIQAEVDMSDAQEALVMMAMDREVSKQMIANVYRYPDHSIDSINDWMTTDMPGFVEGARLRRALRIA